MAGQSRAEVLRRIVRPPQAPAPMTPARALRLALTRASDRAASLALGVLGVTEEVAPLDDLLGRIEDGLMLVALAGEGGPVGIVGLDGEARAAVIEALALGRPAARAAEPRPITAADVALAEPLLAAFLGEVAAATAGTPLDGWVGAARLVGRVGGAREAGLLLPDGRYRAVRLTLDLGAGGRQGLLLLMIRAESPSPAAPEPDEPQWENRLSAQVLRAEAPVAAVLPPVRLTLEAAEALTVGQVLPLPGVTVACVRLQGPGGADLGSARLGQLAGRRAIRLEAPLAPQLGAMPPPAARALPPAGG